MWYHIYEAQMQASAPFRAAALAALQMRPALHGAADTPYARQLMAALEMATRAKLTHESQPFGIKSVTVENREALVAEETALDLPFGRMLHFRKDIDAPQPRVLIVAPLSGHFATLLRNTVKTMLQDHDVYITDWKNARNVPLAQGRFGFEEYVDYLIKMLEHLGPGTHLVAVCQPCVQAMVATAVMAASKNKCEPRSLTLMAGPIDCRINPTAVNNLATDHPIEWFRNNLISTVPFPLPAWGRRVYPGFMQLAAFISMNPERHLEQHKTLYRHLVEGEEDEAERIKTFYDEYFAVLDLTGPRPVVLRAGQQGPQPVGLGRGERRRIDAQLTQERASLARQPIFTVEQCQRRLTRGREGDRGWHIHRPASRTVVPPAATSASRAASAVAKG